MSQTVPTGRNLRKTCPLLPPAGDENAALLDEQGHVARAMPLMVDDPGAWRSGHDGFVGPNGPCV